MVLSPAKINLYLHVCGKRADGYHLLDSLMAPLAFGDTLEITSHSELSLEVIGSSLAQEPVEKNLVMKAARMLQEVLNTTQGAKMVLHKRIPHAAGLGGGSSNAATALKLLLQLWNKKLDSEQLLKLATSLGADVPFFLSPSAQYAEGIGEKLTPVGLPKLHLLLFNSGTAVPTVDVFKKGFAEYSRPAIKRQSFADVNEVILYLQSLNNDLTKNATMLAPEIEDILLRIEKSPGCLLARMSGSGATCFGIFESAESCTKAALQFPNYWVKTTHTL
jgi:4-diphosphocytidyl-2-C-methyl-D-erythritol kinase